MVDDSGFAHFYEATRHRMVTVLYALGGDLADAQDASQEAYARAWQQWNRLQTYDDPEAWVRTVGYRLLLNRIRKIRNGLRAYRRHGANDAVPPPSEDVVALVAGLRRLPEDQRLAIVLHHLVDLSVVDVAAQTGVPINTVKARLARGRRALADLVGASLQEEATHA
jgi:RNA polymerase sigma-70 factor (ECF subfamily)